MMLNPETVLMWSAATILAADFRRYDGTSNGPVSPPVDPISVPRNHPNKETTDD